MFLKSRFRIESKITSKTCLYLICFMLLSSQYSCKLQNPELTIQTELGDIILEIYIEEAPVTATNFIEHAKAGNFKGAQFYRVVNEDNQPNNDIKIDVIQGGLFYDSIVDKHPTIIHETTAMTGIKHLNGTLSMARLEPGTASTEFFICLGDQPELDFMGKRNPDKQGFAAFGRVISGMDVVSKIHKMPNTDQYLDETIIIKNIILDKHSD